MTDDKLLAELGRTIARCDDGGLLVIATAMVSAVRAGGALAEDPGAREVLSTLAAVIGSEQRARVALRRQAALDQANTRVPEAWWGPPETKAEPEPDE
jgi:hypothetical protein